jgi:hypothetical protein
MEEFTALEKEIMNSYKKFTNFYYDPEKKRQYDKWMKDGTIEKTWIQIYKKIPIETHIHKLLFVQNYDQNSIITEMDEYIEKNLN